MRESKRWLSVPAIAECLAVSEDKVRAWLVSGELRGVDVSTHRGQRPRWRIDPDDLQRFLDARAATPAPRAAKRTSRRKADPSVIAFYS